MAYDFDVVVIGSGPGGYVAAIRAAQLGLRAAVVEKGSVGGVCLNIGCIPSKAIIHQAEIFRGRAALEAQGVRVDVSGWRYENVFKASRKAAETLSRGVSYLLKKNGIEVIAGTARLASGHEVVVDTGSGERRVGAGAIILATGSRPRAIPGFEFDGERVLSSDDALMLKELPRRALVVGAGAVGAEFAHILNAFGSEVHLVETADRILPLEDGEVTAVLDKSFRKRGIKIHTASKVSSYNIDKDAISAVIEPRSSSGAAAEPAGAATGGAPQSSPNAASASAGKTSGGGGSHAAVSVDRIFVMAGRAPNTEGIGLEELGIALSNGFVEVGDYYQTRVPSVYAIGDIVGSSPLLAHVASREGEIAAERIAGRSPLQARVDLAGIPSVVYCEPQVASFGLNEAGAAERGRPFVTASFPFRGCGKAVAVGEADGMVKALCDAESKKILGAHIVGAGASELIHELLLAREAGLDAARIASMIHAHPTLSEAVMEAARAVEGWAIHV